MNATPAPFRLHNTLTRQAEDFVPLQPGKVGLYVCGMTVYDHAHVGHGRAYAVFDAFVRWLRHRGWDVTYVRNFTDVDDKIIRRAHAEGIDPMVVAQTYIDSFTRDMADLGLGPADHEPRVSTSIDDIVALIADLVDKGHAYAKSGSVWFRVGSCPDYGCLSGIDPDEMRAAPDEGTKDDPRDFALWKGAKPGEPSWPSPWGDGRPGWHIECSAMSKHHLGATFDIHGGGRDLVFPHHENEVAQSTCGNGAPYARYWMHNGLLTLVKEGADGTTQDTKMGKSLGNVVGIHDALQTVPAEAMRLYYLAAHYRSPLPWTSDALVDALGQLARLYEARDVAASLPGTGNGDAIAKDIGPDALEVLERGRAFEEAFTAALDDDFNTAEALGLAFALARAINRFANLKAARKRGGPVVAPALAAFEHLKAIGLMAMTSEAFHAEVKAKRLGAMGLDEATVEGLLEARTAARTAKDWAEADRLRDELDRLGIIVMDAADGCSWKVRLGE